MSGISELEESAAVASVSAARDRAQIRSRLFRDSSWVLGTQVLALLCSVASNFLIAWSSGPEGRGLIYVIQVISGVGLIVLNFALGPAAVYFLGRERQRHSPAAVAAGLFWTTLLVSIVPALLLLAVQGRLPAQLLHKVPLRFLWLALLSLVPMIMAFNAGYFCLAKSKIGLYNWLRTSPQFLLAAFLLIPNPWSRHDPGLIALLWFVSIALPGIQAGVWLGTQPGQLFPAGMLAFVKEAMRFGWRSHLGAVTQYFQHRVDVLLVGFFLPISALGIYAFAVSLAELLWYVPQSVATALLPHVAANSDEDVRHITPFFCRLSVGVTAVLSLLLAIAATVLVPRLLPAFQSSVRIVWILLPGVVAAAVFKVLASDFNGRGEPTRTWFPAGAALLCCLVAGIFVTPRFGLAGQAVVTSCGYLLNATLYLFSYRRLTATPIVELLAPRKQDFRRPDELWEALKAQGAE